MLARSTDVSTGLPPSGASFVEGGAELTPGVVILPAAGVTEAVELGAFDPPTTCEEDKRFVKA